jgi:hypothetical protein
VIFTLTPYIPTRIILVLHTAPHDYAFALVDVRGREILPASLSHSQMSRAMDMTLPSGLHSNHFATVKLMWAGLTPARSMGKAKEFPPHLPRSAGSAAHPSLDYPSVNNIG